MAREKSQWLEASGDPRIFVTESKLFQIFIFCNFLPAWLEFYELWAQNLNWEIKISRSDVYSLVRNPNYLSIMHIKQNSISGKRQSITWCRHRKRWDAQPEVQSVKEWQKPIQKSDGIPYGIDPSPTSIQFQGIYF